MHQAQDIQFHASEGAHDVGQGRDIAFDPAFQPAARVLLDGTGQARGIYCSAGRHEGGDLRLHRRVGWRHDQAETDQRPIETHHAVAASERNFGITSSPISLIARLVISVGVPSMRITISSTPKDCSRLIRSTR